MSDVYQKNLIKLIRTYGMNFKDALVYDRIREELHIFCANHTVDEVYNSMFLSIVAHVKNRVQLSIERLGEGGIKLLNLVVPKPDIPTDIAANYKQVRAIKIPPFSTENHHQPHLFYPLALSEVSGTVHTMVGYFRLSRGK
jgi:hypothetical protein